MDWHPSADMARLRLRARVLAEIRAFFRERGVLEAETPLLCQAGVTDPHLSALTVDPGDGSLRRLQTSPEFAMKRLLAAGSGPIYQVCKAFRAGESGARHNPEFTLLEWYRPGLDHLALMDEVAALLERLLGRPLACERLRYGEAFQRHAGIDPHGADCAALRHCFQAGSGVTVTGVDPDDRDAWLDLILSHLVEPHLGVEHPLFLYDYPACQAALARIRPGDPPLAERFELYMAGMEIANGYHELNSAPELARRMAADRARRRDLRLPDVPPDQRLLAALEHGLPDCAGVALGLDRLLMVMSGADAIGEVLAFHWERA